MSAHPGCNTAHPASRRRHAAAALLLLAASAWGQAAPSPSPPPGAASAARLAPRLVALLEHPSPEVRGEAALGLAATGAVEHYPALLRVARDRAEPARLRGILAVGRMAAPGAESFLGDILLDPGVDEAERAVAALALGLLPDERSAAAVDEFATRVRGGSYRRNRAALSGLLLGFAQSPHPRKAPLVRAVLEDAANRDPGLRRLAMLALATAPDQVERIDFSPWLSAESAQDRLGALHVLRHTQPWPDDTSGALVERLAARDPDAAVRAAAIRTLTAARRLSALEIAARALRSDHAAEVAAGVAAARQLGGGAIRAAIERRILETSRPELQAAMLAAYDRSLSPWFLDACLRIAADPREPARLRAEAAAVAARSRTARAGQPLRDLFLLCESADELQVVTEAVCGLDPTWIEAERIFPGAADDQRLLPARLRALLGAGHPAGDLVLDAALGGGRLSSPALAEVLRALRLVLVPPPEPDILELLPAPLRALLA